MAEALSFLFQMWPVVQTSPGNRVSLPERYIILLVNLPELPPVLYYNTELSFDEGEPAREGEWRPLSEKCWVN